jgi:hypothetical protein
MHLGRRCLFSCPFFPASSQAFSYWQCDGEPTIWRSNQTFLSNQFNIPAGSADEGDVQEALQRWTLIPGAWFEFTMGTVNSNTTSNSDGQNRIEYNFPAEVGVGHAHIRYTQCAQLPGPNQSIEEVDVHFVADWLSGAPLTWTHGAPNPRSSSQSPLRSAAVHELGHAVGLSPTNALHENGLLDTMNASMPAGGFTDGFASIRVVPLPESARGFRFLYTDFETDVDQFTSNFRLFAGTTGAVLVPSLPSCAKPGDPITVFFTTGNRGNSASLLTSCGVYMSSDEIISTLDTQLLDCTWQPSAHALVEAFSFTLTVPLSTPTGTTQFFGMFVDDAFAVSESIESNNGVAAPGSPSSLAGVLIQAFCP